MKSIDGDAASAEFHENGMDNSLLGDRRLARDRVRPGKGGGGTPATLTPLRTGADQGMGRADLARTFWVVTEVYLVKGFLRAALR
jgi:hypothetical protein